MRPRKTKPGFGFALIELLVVIGIIGLFISFTLPAVQSGPQAARRLSCANHLKQIGIALQNYESAIGSFPPWGSWNRVGTHSGYPVSSDASAHCMLLLHLQEVGLYNSINFNTPMSTIFSLGWLGASNQTTAIQTVGTFLCPSDPMTTPQPYGPNSYRANAGLCGFCPPVGGTRFLEDGAFTIHGSRASEFTDGLSNTIAMSEKLISGQQGYVSDRDWIFLDPRTLPGGGFIPWPDWISVCSSQASILQTPEPAGRTWMIGGAYYTAFFCGAPPNAPVPDCGVGHNYGTGVFAARSYHPGGVNTLMADGSVRWVGSGINPTIWRAMGTRQEGDLVAPGP